MEMGVSAGAYAAIATANDVAGDGRSIWRCH